MRYRKPGRSLAIGIAGYSWLAVSSVGTSWSQDGAVPEPGDAPLQGVTLQEVIVTAERRATAASRVPMSISAVPADALLQQGITQPSDLSKVVPGFNYTQSAYGAPVYTIRGIGFYDTALGAAPTVSVYMDEAPLPFSIMTSGVAFDLERVEVLKGPQGILYGQNSTGGAINYIAAKPTDEFSFGADLSYGRFDEMDLRSFVSGPLGPTLRARAAVRVNRSDDWQESFTRDDTIGSTDMVSGRVLLEWEASDRILAQLNLNGWRDKSDNQVGQLAAIIGSGPRLPDIIRDYPLPPADNIRAADWDPGVNFRRDDSHRQASLRIEFDLGAATRLTSVTAYQEFERDSYQDIDGLAYHDYHVEQVGDIESFSQELRLNGEVGDSVRWLFGANFAQDDVYEKASPSAVRPQFTSWPVSGASAVGYTDIQTVAAFAHVDWTLLPDLTLQAGLRYTDNEQDFRGCTLDPGDGSYAAVVSNAASGLAGRQIVILPGECATVGTDFEPGFVSDSLRQDNLSWRLGLSYQATPNVLTYANVTRGYKSGNFPVAGATFSAGLAPATQESVLAYETGFKARMAGGKVQLNAAAFYSNYEDKQVRGRVQDPALGRINRFVNIPKSRVYGAEAQLTWMPVRGLLFNGGATYVDSRIDNYLGNDAFGNPMQLEGQQFPLTPDWQLNASAEYEWPVANYFSGFIGADYTYQAATNSGLGELPTLEIPDYQLVGARAGVRADDDSWSASLFVRNLTDERYWNFASSAGVPDTLTYFMGRPRTYGVMLSFRY